MEGILNDAHFQEVLENETFIDQAIEWFLDKALFASPEWLNNRSFELMLALGKAGRLVEAEEYIVFAQNEKWRIQRRKYLEQKWENLEKNNF